MEHKVGIALGGGGARGSYQIGILKALREAGILHQVHHMSGTSIGAINTLLVMADLSYDRMVDIWLKITNEDIYGQGLDRFKIDRLGLFSLKDLYDKLCQEISIDEIRKSKIEGYVTAAKLQKQSLIDQVMLHRMKNEVFHLNNFEDPHKAVLASASIPVLFGSTKLNEETYVDGGTIDGCPLEPLVSMGCDIILAVPIDGRFKPKKQEHFDILLVDFTTHHLFHTIPYDIFNFKPKYVLEKAEYGYQMGKIMIEKLRQLNILNDLNEWQRPEGHHRIEINKKEEKELMKEVKSWT
jgi:NTE family protein